MMKEYYIVYSPHFYTFQTNFLYPENCYHTTLLLFHYVCMPNSDVLAFTQLELMALLLESFRINPLSQPSTQMHTDTQIHCLKTPEGKVTKEN